MDDSQKKEVVRILLSKGMIVTTELLSKADSAPDIESFIASVTNSGGSKPCCSGGIRVVKSHKTTPGKYTVQDFIKHFNARFFALEKILRCRQELQGVISVARVSSKRDKETVSVIGMVFDKQVTKNNNIVLVMEDPTGQVKAIINRNKQEVWDVAKDIVLDSVIGITGTVSNGVVFVNSVFLPDVPASNELKKSPEEGFVVVLSDLHIGSAKFLEAEFSRFLSWIRGEAGTEEQRRMAQKVKCVFILGDLVDGVGIYPSQENELNITCVKEQYAKCARILSQIPSSIPIVICGGNHDAVEMSEPQPELRNEYTLPIAQLPNVVLVSNPAVVSVGATDGFDGFNFLLYHGYGFDDYVSVVESIRANGGYNRPDLIMKFLLQCRHLAPSHTSTIYIPDPQADNLVIDQLPDFFLAGHIHKTSAANYRGITMICGSCWQSKTAFQEKVGHVPEPCRVPVIDLKTRAVRIMRF